MIDELSNVRVTPRVTSTDRWLDEQPEEKPDRPPHPLDSPSSKKRLTKLMEWYNAEREKQSVNRYQQAIDEDFYDNLQWSDEDAEEVMERGQAPLTFNEVATTIDWIIGTEKRTRVDFKVLPRAEDDVKVAHVKTQTLKFTSDVNKVPFARSLAFADSVKVGVGWLEDGARTDPTEEPVFSRHESWRNIIWDSCAKERDLSDARYLFRIRWVDLDIAIAMFPARKSQLEQAAVAANLWGSEEDEDLWYLGQHLQQRDMNGQVIHRRTYISDAGMLMNRRARVRLIEAWYREPERCFMCQGEVFDGERFDAKNPAMAQAYQQGVISIYDHLMMKVRCAIMTERDMMQDMPSPYRHNRFPFTPIWCYRRGRDGMPYGPIRRIRDPQEDLNKRASKALFMISTNRVVADADSVEDHDEAREEAARPDAYIIKKRGTEFRIENNAEFADRHLALMDRDERMIQKAGGVTDENLGRRTNAVSGEAIKARQLQGSVVTAEIFDNLRFAVQLQGEVQLSLAEQFITEAKVIRLLGARGKIDWVKINQPEPQPDGSVRYINDITASKADFVVDEQDFSQSVRQSMFESMTELVGRIAQVNPIAALKILKMALEFSDLPNKEDMAREIASLVGITDKDPADMTPEEREEYEVKKQSEEMQSQMQMEAATKEIQEKAAKIDKLLADAERARADAEHARAQAMETAQRVIEQHSGGMNAEADEKEARTRDLASQMAQAIGKIADQTGEAVGAVADQNAQAVQTLAVALSKQNEQTVRVIAEVAQNTQRAITDLAQGQREILEAVGGEHEFDFRYDQNGNISGASKKPKRQSVKH